MKGDTDAAIEFLKAFRSDGSWLLHAIDPEKRGGMATAHCWVWEFKERDARAFVDKWNGKRNIYFAVNPPTGEMLKKASAADIKEVRYLHVDVDPRAGEDLIAEQERIAGLAPDDVPTPTFTVFSGGGYQHFWRLKEPIPINGDLKKAEDAKLYNIELERKYGADACHNVDRIMRLVGTINVPDAKKRSKGRVKALAKLVKQTDVDYPIEEFTKAEPVTKPSPGIPPAQAIGSATLDSVDDLNEWHVDDSVKAIIVSGPDPEKPKSGDNSRSAGLCHVVCHMVRRAVPDDVIFGAITDPDWAISDSVLDKGGKAERYALRTITRAKEEVSTDWDPQSKEGIPGKSYVNARLAVQRLGVTTEHDVFRNKLNVGGHVLGDYAGPVTDNAMSMLRQLILECHKFDPGKEHLEDATKQLCIENDFDPVVDGLASLKWDGIERLDGWLTRYLRAEENDYVSAVGRLLLVAAVRRARSPGCKFDTIVVLEGPQGSGKSTALLILAGHDDFFSDSDILAGTAQQQAENIQGVWFYELAELEGLRAAQVTKVKAFASRQSDRARAAYGRHREDKPRRCVFIGTTNDVNYLSDRTGNRRFLPVLTDDIDLEGLRADRNQLLAEAAKVEADGEPIYLPTHLWETAGNEQAKRLAEDPWESILADFEADPLGDGPVRVDRSGKEKIFTRTILNCLDIDKGEANVNHTIRIGSIMRGLGWTGPVDLKIGGTKNKGYWRLVAGSEAKGLREATDEAQ